MHGCMLSLKNQQWYRASYVTISYTSILTYLPCCGVKRVADTFVEVSLLFGFCCWLTPITLTVLCVSTCSDGLLDFHSHESCKDRITKCCACHENCKDRITKCLRLPQKLQGQNHQMLRLPRKLQEQNHQRKLTKMNWMDGSTMDGL